MTPDLVGDLHERARTDPSSIDRTDVDDVVEFLDPGTTEAETVERAVEVVELAVEADPRVGIRAIPALTPLVGSDREEIRNRALSSLVRISSEHPQALQSATPELLARLSGVDDPERRARLLLVLARVAAEDPEVVAADRLVEYVDDESAAVRANATRALAEVTSEAPDGVGGAVPVLLDRLAEAVAGTRIDAARALAGIAEGRPAALDGHVEDVLDAVDDTNPRVRQAAVRTLASVAVAEPPAVAPHSERLLGLLADDSDAVADAAVEALLATAVTDPEGTARRLVDRLDDPATRDDADRVLRGIAMRNPRPVVDALGDALDHDDPAVRRVGAGIFRAVAKHRPQRVRPVADRLVARLSDPDEAVRRETAAAVGAAAPDHPEAYVGHADELLSAVRPPDGNLAAAIAAVAESDPAAVDASAAPVDALLAAEDPDVRASGCRVLGAAGDRSALERLREHLDDGDRTVEVAALEAMAALAERTGATLTGEERRRIGDLDDGRESGE